MAKTKKQELSIQEKTKVLAEIMPNELEIHEKWKTGANGKYFDGWNIFARPQSKWVIFQQVNVALNTTLIIHLSENCSVLSVLEYPTWEFTIKAVEALEKGINEHFGVSPNSFRSYGPRS